jgi:hypothetical protein
MLAYLNYVGDLTSGLLSLLDMVETQAQMMLMPRSKIKIKRLRLRSTAPLPLSLQGGCP